MMSCYHGLALVAILIMATEAWSQAILVPLVLVNYWWQYYRLRQWQDQRLVWASDQEWSLCQKVNGTDCVPASRGAWGKEKELNAQGASVCSSCPDDHSEESKAVRCRFFFITPWLVACRITSPDAFLPRSLVFTHKAATVEHWRQLQLLLRCQLRDDGQSHPERQS